MRVYLAAGFSRKDEIAAKSKELQALGVEVTSTWPWEEVAPTTQLHDVTTDYLAEHAERDIREIGEADAVILFTQDPTKPFCRGGRMHEFGYGHGKGKRLIVVGPRENIFHYLRIAEVFESWEALLVMINQEIAWTVRS